MKRRIVGFVLVLFSIFLAFFNSPKITGAVIGEPLTNVFSFFVALFFVVGVVLILTADTNKAVKERGLELVVSVYDDHKDKGKNDREDEHYFMTDPRLDFGSKGYVSLGEFRREIKGYRNEKNEDLVEIIREEYQPNLINIVSSEDTEKAKIARAFLNVLNPGLNENAEEYYQLSSTERREIHLAFRGWGGSLSKVDKNIRRKYGIIEEMGGKHVKLYQRGHESNCVSTSSTPSVSMGDRLATQIIYMIEKNRQKKK